MTRTKVELPKLRVLAGAGDYASFEDDRGVTFGPNVQRWEEITHRCNVHDELVNFVRHYADNHGSQHAADLLTKAEGRAEASEISVGDIVKERGKLTRYLVDDVQSDTARISSIDGFAEFRGMRRTMPLANLELISKALNRVEASEAEAQS